MIKSELLEFRRVLENWQNHPPKVIQSVLVQIIEKRITYQDILESRIYKSIKELTQADLTNLPLLHSKTEYQSVFEQAKTLHKIIMDLASSNKLEKQSSTQSDDSISKTSKPTSQIQLFEGFVESNSSYIKRGPVLNAISKGLLVNFQNANGNGDIEKKDLNQIKEITVGLEKEIYFKNQFKSNPVIQYQQDVKTLMQYIKKDKSGSVTMRLMDNSLTVKKAAELKTEDWVDDETKKKASELQKQMIAEAQTGFYEDLKKREMGQVQGRKCGRCKNDSVYLVEEKQTRRSDEPTTKFYECFNCGDKFRH